MVDTAAGKWKDIGGGLKIAPADDTEPPEAALYHRTSFGDSSDNEIITSSLKLMMAIVSPGC